MSKKDIIESCTEYYVGNIYKIEIHNDCFFLTIKNNIERPKPPKETERKTEEWKEEWIEEIKKWRESHVFYVSEYKHLNICKMIICGTIKVGDYVKCNCRITKYQDRIDVDLESLSIVESEEDK